MPYKIFDSVHRGSNPWGLKFGQDSWKNFFERITSMEVKLDKDKDKVGRFWQNYLDKGDLQPVVGLDVEHVDLVAGDGKTSVILK